MLPLHDDNPTSHFPLVTLIVIALNVMAFLFWEPTLGSHTEVQQEAFFFCHAEIPYEVTHQASLSEGGGEARNEISDQLGATESQARDFQRFLARKCPDKSWWQSVFVAMFLHGGWLHIGGNMLFLWIFGNNVEDKLGAILYFLFYLAAGIAASIGQLLIDTNSVVPNLGASGAIAGVLGAYIVMFPRRRVLTLVFFFFITAIWLPAWTVLGAWFILQLFNGVGAVTAHISSGVAFFPKEGLGTRPPPPRPDFQSRRWGRGWGRGQPPSDEGWRPY